MTSERKLFLGARVRRMREQRGWNQNDLATRLKLSMSYVSQIENDQRPVTASVLLKLAESFGGDVTQFADEPQSNRLTELDAAMRDRTLRSESLPPATLSRMIASAPELVDTFLTLYQRHVRLQDEYAHTVDRLYGDLRDIRGNEALIALPQDEVREHFNRRNNYLDTIDRLGESLALDLGLQPGARAAALAAALLERTGTDIVETPAADGWLRRYRAGRRQLVLMAGLSDAQRAFQIATQYALLIHREALDDEVKAAGFTDAVTSALALQGVAHYFAGAVLLPYAQFLDDARACRYDIELLERRHQVSFETVCHRLSTLQRAGARSVPFYFVRVDQAGNISKRQSATTFHFARHGGACPLWHVHEAFARPGRIISQVVEMPDGTRFFGVARTIERGGAGYRVRRKLFAIGLGCELSMASELVYADGIDTAHPSEVVPIGPGCRVCPRQECEQRAFPPAGKPIRVDVNAESMVSYRFD